MGVCEEMSNIKKATAIAYKLHELRRDIDVTPEDVLTKVSGPDELNFYWTMLCFGGGI